MMNGSNRKRNSVLVTGAGGYIGRQLIEALARDRRELKTVVAADVRETPPDERLTGIDYVTADIRSSEVIDIFRRFSIDTVVHLATIVTPGRKSNREFEYSVDVLGTEKARHTATMRTTRNGWTRTTPCGVTLSSPTPTTKGWWRRCWPAIAMNTRN
jgi:nucleoside-diphosphate-sugar epimerase